jgi:Skp family chaperone for outer membrane proteins
MFRKYRHKTIGSNPDVVPLGLIGIRPSKVPAGLTGSKRRLLMKTTGIIIGIIIIGIIGCYSAITAQDATTPPPKPAPNFENPASPEVKPPSTDINVTPPATEVKPNPNVAAFPFKVGVVNIAEVFDKYSKTKEYERILQKEKEREELLINEIKMKIKKLREEIEVLSPGSELYREKSEELAKEQARYEYRAKTWNEYIKNKVNEQTLKLYKEIRETITKYAVDNGYTFIFKSDPALSATPQSDDVTQQISIRTVLYAPKETDITEDIIKILNK